MTIETTLYWYRVLKKSEKNVKFLRKDVVMNTLRLTHPGDAALADPLSDKPERG
jgi:hypothetical protein